MKRLIAVFILLLTGDACFAQHNTVEVPFQNIGNKFKLIGELGKPFGTPLTVKGIIVDYFSKQGDNGPNLIVQMINDSATQSYIQIPISDFDGTRLKYPTANVKYGATYKFKVYETANFIGMPWAMYKEEPFVPFAPKFTKDDSLKGNLIVVPGYFPQGVVFHFQNRLMAKYWEEMEPIEWSPALFIQRNALLSGIAENEGDTATIENTGWKLKLVGCNKWPGAAIGKPAEVYGIVKKTTVNSTYLIETGWTRLVKLEDQIGKTVKLRGRAVSLNGHWWFNYRGTDIYVENMEKLSNWTVDNHFRTMEITGMLEQALLPDIGQINLQHNPDIKLNYIVKNASWVPIDELLLPELPYDKYGIR